MKVLLLLSIVVSIFSCASAQLPQKDQRFVPDKNDPLSKPIQEPSPAQPAASLSKEEAELLIKIKTAELHARAYAMAPSNKDNAGATNQLTELYSKAVKSGNVMRFLVGDALSDYYELKEGARGAAQVSQAADQANMKLQPLMLAQNQVIIEQNQRIIALLEQLVRKR